MDCCAQGSICFELLKGVPTAVVALAIGLAAAVIAWRQYRVAKAKLSLDLFDKRYRIFEETWKILSEAVTTGTRTKSYGLGTPFNNFLPEARFLFGKDIADYLDMALKNWSELWSLEAVLASVSGGNQVQIARSAELQRWFAEQASNGVKEKFGPYLNFERWR